MLSEMEEKYDRIVYCDMDGVLCGFIEGFSLLPSSNRLTPEEYDSKTGKKDSFWKIIDDYGKENFFAGLPWKKEGGKELWNYLNDNFLHVKILTALGKSDVQDSLTSRGKTRWLHLNIPMLNQKDIIMVPNKHAKKHYAKSDDILIDDTEICIQEWIQKGGIGILHKTLNQTIGAIKKYI